MSHASRAVVRAFISIAFAGVALLAPARAASQQQQPQSDCARDSTQRTPQDSARHVGHEPTTLPCVRVVASSAKRADAASTVVILPTAIRTVPATDVWDMVRQAAGMEVHLQGQGPGFASDAAFRGFTSDHSSDVAASIDGVPVNEPVNGHAEGYSDWNSLMPEAVSSVEITEGPAVPNAGNFAMGGVVDVKTKQVAVGTEWSARVGSYGDARLTMLTGDANDSGGYMIAADAQRGDGWRDNSQEWIGHLMANKVWTDSGGRTYALGAIGYGGKWHSPGYIDTTQYNEGQLTEATNPTDGGNETYGTVRGSLSQPGWSGTITSTLYAQASWWNIFLTIPPEGSVGEGVNSQEQETDQRYGLGGATRWAKQLGSTHLIAGIEYRLVGAEFQSYFTTNRTRDSVDAAVNGRYASVSPVVDAHWDATDKLSFGIGARLDWLYYASQDLAGGPWTTNGRWLVTPKLSAVYHFTNAFLGYASYNAGFRSSDGVLEDPTLAPTLEDASEVGIRYTGSRLEGSVGLFLINVRNQQTINPITLAATNGGTTRQQGVELSGRAGLTRWLALFVHATFNDAHYTNLVTSSIDGTDTVVTNLAGVPVYQVAKSVVNAGFDFDWKGITGSAWATYTGAWTPVDEPDVRTQPYTLVNLRATFPIGGPWSGELGIQNIFDQRYKEVQADGSLNPGSPTQVLLTVRHGF